MILGYKQNVCQLSWHRFGAFRNVELFILLHVSYKKINVPVIQVDVWHAQIWVCSQNGLWRRHTGAQSWCEYWGELNFGVVYSIRENKKRNPYCSWIASWPPSLLTSNLIPPPIISLPWCFGHINITSSFSKPPTRPHLIPFPALSSSGPPGWEVSMGQELVTPSFTVSPLCPDPQCCSITALFPFSVLHTNTHPLHSLSDPLFSLSSLSPAFCAPSLAQAVLGCHIDWGFYSPSLTSSSLPLSIPFVPQCTVMLKPLWSACLCLCTAFLNVSIYCKLYYHAMHDFSLSSKRAHTHKHAYYRYILIASEDFTLISL